MLYLDLFLTFLKIGALSFGGGYGMISLIREEVLAHGWLTEEDLLNRIAVSESTPGPIAVNMATFIGADQGGFLGSLVATCGVVLPSFVIILLIATLIQNLLKYKGVQAFLNGVRPCIVGLIFATAATFFLSTILGITSLATPPSIDLRGMLILGILVAIGVIYKHKTKKRFSPILMIIISAGLGMLFYSIP